MQGGEEAQYRKFYKVYKKLWGANVQIDESVHRVSLCYGDLVDAIVILRNRYFHLLAGALDNVHTHDVDNPDLFFQQTNNAFLNWLSIIYFEIVKGIATR